MIGQTDRSIVYRAYDQDLGRTVVIKAPIDEQNVVDFAESVRDAARIADEPNFVKLYEAVLPQRQPYCVMQCIDGQNLRTWIQSDGHRPLAIVIRILSRIRGIDRRAHAGLELRELEAVQHRPREESLIDTACGTPMSTDFIFDPRRRRDEPFDEVFRDRVYAAWREVLRPGVEYMKGKY